MPMERLQKIIARAGLASRRGAEELITQGRVTVDGETVTSLGSKADPEKQRVAVNGQALPFGQKLEYWLIHKPRGYLSTVKDTHGRKTLMELLPPEVKGRLYPVGRLDYNTEGLVLMTNDGELAHRMTHPRFHIPKRYKAWVEGWPSDRAINQLRRGVEIEDGHVTAPAKVSLKAPGKERSKLSITLFEGRKRQIRLMCEAVGHPVKRLVRVAIGPIPLGSLDYGQARPMKASEIKALKENLGLISGCKPSTDGVKKFGRGRRGETRFLDRKRQGGSAGSRQETRNRRGAPKEGVQSEDTTSRPDSGGKRQRPKPARDRQAPGAARRESRAGSKPRGDRKGGARRKSTGSSAPKGRRPRS